MNSTAKIYNIHEPFPFDRLALMKPFNRAGSYFIRIETAGMPLYIQPPKCELKQGFIKSGKKTLCDLVFSTENEKFLEWLERFEERCYLQIYDNRDKWFDPVLEKHEIEDYMTSPYKMYKSGKYYIIRTDVPTNLGKCEIKIYNEKEQEIDPETLTENTNVVTIMELKGIKCSIRSFQFEIELKQMLVLEPSRLFEKLIIRGGNVGRKPIESTDYSGSLATKVDSFHRKRTPMGEDLRRLEFQKRKLEREQKYKQKMEINRTEETPQTNEVLANPTLENNALSVLDAETMVYNQESASSPSIEMLREKIDGLQQNEDPRIGLEPVEFELDLAKIEEEPVHLKNKNDIYYEKYKEAKKKAKEAKIIALTNYLEAKRIKSTYLEELDLSDSDNESQFSDLNDDVNSAELELNRESTNLKGMLHIEEL